MREVINSFSLIFNSAVAALATALTCVWGANYCRTDNYSNNSTQDFTQEKLIVDIIENY